MPISYNDVNASGLLDSTDMAATGELHNVKLHPYIFLVPNDEAVLYTTFLSDTRQRKSNDLADQLSSIPYPPSPSYGPLATLSALITTSSKQWPVLELQETHSRLWKRLPEVAKSGRPCSLGEQLLDRVSNQCKQSYSSILDLLHHSSDATAIIDPSTGSSLSHSNLSAIIQGFSLPLPSSPSKEKPVIAISLPNGPLLALTCLATAAYYTVCPIAHGPGVGAEQLKADVLQSRSNIVLASPSDVSRLGLRNQWLAEAGIKVLLVELHPGMHIGLRDLDGNLVQKNSCTRTQTPNSADDTAILLFTSGTTGSKKLAPLSIHSLVCGVAMVVDSWGLSPSMRCLNQMPLNHVGGLVRNLFAPIFSGGSVICCSAFDANLFWDCVEDYAPTWYYASPSMHQCILEVGISRPESLEKSKIRMVCNAAGGLLPSLATQLRNTFSKQSVDCAILPSYGMTECMPISTPPLNYRLEKSGTSGISVGPEIAILDKNECVVDHKTIGRIGVRGAPLFAGYLKANNDIDDSCFTTNGWFDTGDLGYLDENGYLYITGRSKEVINRGGELISPFEVEEAILTAASDPASATFGRISKVLAFSVSHDVLQEVVGVAVTSFGKCRAALRDIQDSVKGVLSSAKVPVLVVYMDGGLPTNNNKVIRIKLASRLGLPEISDDTPPSLRHYEALCPEPNMPVQAAIECSLLTVDYHGLSVAYREVVPDDYDTHIQLQAGEISPELVIAPISATVLPTEVSSDALTREIRQREHSYNVPSKIHLLDLPFPRKADDTIDAEALEQKLARPSRQCSVSELSSTEATVASIFSHILNVSLTQLLKESDFFELGGDSLRAGRLLSALRKEFQLRLPIDVLFTSRQICAIAALIDAQIPDSQPDREMMLGDPDVEPELQPGCEETYSSTRPLLLLLQLLPIGLFYPGRRALTWTLFMYVLASTQSLYTNQSIPGRLVNLVISMAAARLATRIVAPLIAIAFKWMVIGRYKEGLYPMWGPYHTRWWLCQKALAVAGFGVFGEYNGTRILYYKLLGTRVGENVTIAKGATLGEYDLITIEDCAVLERCIVRPFAAERNTSMYLGRITIGANSSVGLGSIVAPGTSLPPSTCIGPNSTSWEMNDANEANRDLGASKVPGAHWALSLALGVPIQIITTFIGAVPWLACLIALVRFEPNADSVDQLRQVTLWFASRQRVGYHYAAMAANAALGPAFYFGSVLLVKMIFDGVCGKIQPSEASSRSQMTRFRMQLMRTLMPPPKFHELSELFGTHYEATSVLARSMGAKVGKRVYWPGTGPSWQDLDLLDIGDDVVFGSRAHLVTSDGSGSDFIRVSDGAMVADRVVLLPGVALGEKTVFGSGARSRRNARYPSSTVWVGSKHNDALCLTAASLPNTVDQAFPARSIIEMQNELRPPPHFGSYASSNTTLVKTPGCGDSIVSVAEKSYLASKSTKIDGGRDVRKASVTVRQVDAPSPADSTEDVTSESLSPFGRAFYKGLATYRVWSQFEIFLYSTVIAVTTVTFWNIGSISAVQVLARLFTDHGLHSTTFLAADKRARPLTLYFFFLALISGIMAVQTIVVLGGLIAAKWILMGRRQPGCYSWDISPYCQRWQLFLKLESLRRHCYGGHGILGMLTGTHWLVLYFRALGASIGKDCALFAGGLPSLVFTEPDLLTLGDRVAVDDASLVAHINTRGKFDLNNLSVGDRSVLRTGSRLLSGARMEADSCLLEHTLVMSGDVVEEGYTNQGWPAESFTGSRMPTLSPRRVWRVGS